MAEYSYKDLPETIRAKTGARAARDTALVWGCLAVLFFLVRDLPWPVWLLIAPVTGALQYHLNILAHDGLHFSLAQNRTANDILTRWFLLAPQLTPMNIIRKNHLHHHRHLGEPADLDREYYEWNHRGSRRQFVFWLLKSFSGAILWNIGLKFLTLSRMKKPELNEEGASKKLLTIEDIAALLVVNGALFLSLATLTGVWWAYFVLWVFPLYTFMTGYNCLRSCLEHVDLGAQANNGHQFSFISNPVERFFLSPFNMNYHAEHHRFIHVPYHRLPELQAWLKANGDTVPMMLIPSYRKKFRDFWRSLEDQNSSLSSFDKA